MTNCKSILNFESGTVKYLDILQYYDIIIYLSHTRQRQGFTLIHKKSLKKKHNVYKQGVIHVQVDVGGRGTCLMYHTCKQTATHSIW